MHIANLFNFEPIQLRETTLSDVPSWLSPYIQWVDGVGHSIYTNAAPDPVAVSSVMTFIHDAENGQVKVNEGIGESTTYTLIQPRGGEGEGEGEDGQIDRGE
jgi:hypothetical protein